MNARIDAYGKLQLMRGTKFRPQYCPFTALNNEGEDPMCGDWCPHFNPRNYEVHLCHGTVIKSENPIENLRD